MKLFKIMFITGRLLDLEVGLAKGDTEEKAVEFFLEGTGKDASDYYAVAKA